MSVGRDQAERIAHLARLRFDDDELTLITAELNHILDYVEALKEAEPRTGESAADGPRHLPTGGAPTVAECAATRDAAAEEPDVLAGGVGALAPEWKDGFFVVPPLPGIQREDDA
jgi:Asp-tRNA(Asn)/Glu-tRNA(Gln) amidotransferase C subunit